MLEGGKGKDVLRGGSGDDVLKGGRVAMYSRRIREMTF